MRRSCSSSKTPIGEPRHYQELRSEGMHDMEVDVRIQDNDLKTAVRNYALRRIHFTLGRFTSTVARVVVRISDVNGARGIDKSCRVGVDVLPSGRVVVEQIDADLFTAIDRACERVGQALRRRIERVRNARTKHESIREPA